MRRYGMYEASRGLTLALAAALAGLGLWGAARVGTQTTDRFWLALVIVAGARLVIALATHMGTWTKGLRLRLSPGTLALAFLPMLVCVGWILVASQPGHGFVLGLSLDGIPAEADDAVPAVDEPVTAERRWSDAREPSTSTDERTRTRTPAH